MKLATILKNSILISDVISDYITLSKKGKNFFGLCPFHNDNNPSLVVNNEKKYFKCFVCGVGGNLISFVEKKENISFTKAVISLAKKYGFETEEMSLLEKKNQVSQEELDFYEMNLQAKEIFHNFLMQKENLKIRQYLYDRGLEDVDLKKFQIGYAPSQRHFLLDIMSNRTNIFGLNRDSKLIWNLNKLLSSNLIILDERGDYQDFFFNRIIFPIQNEWKKTVGFSGRSIDKFAKVKYINSKSSKFFKKDSILYNMENVWNGNYKKIFLTEGFIDVIHASKNGLVNIVGTMGVILSKGHIEKIKRQNFEVIVISMDNDRAGILSNMKMGSKLVSVFPNTMIVKKYDSDCKDLADLSLKLSNSRSFLLKINDYVTYIEYLILTIFQNENKQIDTRLSNLRKVAREIFYYSDVTLKNYYVRLLAEKSHFLEKDIINTIQSFNGKNTKNIIAFNNEILSPGIFVESDTDVFNLKSIFSNKITLKEIKLAFFEKQLILIMVNNSEIASFFIQNLNQINYLKNCPDYLTVFKIIQKLINQKELDYSRFDIMKLVESHLEKSSKFIQDINFYISSFENFNFTKEKERGLKIIKELIKAKIKSIEKKQADKLNKLYIENADQTKINELKKNNKLVLDHFKNYEKNVELEIIKTQK